MPTGDGLLTISKSGLTLRYGGSVERFRTEEGSPNELKHAATDSK